MEGLRKCNDCGEWKYEHEFAKDTTRKGGYSYMCRKCKNAYAKERSRVRQDFKRHKDSENNHMMTDEVFRLFYEDKKLKDYICNQAIRYSKHDRDYQKDLVQVAWGRIALCRSGKTAEYYMKQAHTAMKTEWQRAWRIREYGLSGIETLTAEECQAWQRGYY